MDSAPTAGRRITDLVIAGSNRRTRRITGRQTVGEVEEDIGGFEIGCVDKRKDVPARAAHFQQVPGTE